MVDRTEPAATTSLTNPPFVGYVATQFFGAFNDNLFKQLLLLLSIPAASELAPGERPPDLQGVATIVFGLPFVLLAGVAGFLADRYSKRTIILACKVAEIVVMGLGLVAFLAAPAIGFAGLWIVLLLMGLQSTFFGPGKYGILPEMLPEKKLERANGVVLMTTFIAIIIGTAMAGPLKDGLVAKDLPGVQAAAGLWIASLVCVGIAVVGTLTAWPITRLGPAQPDMRLTKQNAFFPTVIGGLLRRDRGLFAALLASCVFWLISGLALQAVNSLGKTQLGLSASKTSLMVALISVGIALGAAVAGAIGRRLSPNAVVRIGMWGVVAMCSLLAVTIPGRGHLLGFYGTLPALIALGAMAAFFAIPIQVFLQARPPKPLKGRMIAVMNQANFLAIVISGALYMLLDRVIAHLAWPRSAIFAVMAALFVPVALTFRLDTSQDLDDLRDAAPTT